MPNGSAASRCSACCSPKTAAQLRWRSDRGTLVPEHCSYRVTTVLLHQWVAAILTAPAGNRKLLQVSIASIETQYQFNAYNDFAALDFRVTFNVRHLFNQFSIDE